MKTVKTIRTVEKAMSICSWLILMVFLVPTVLAAAEPNRDDLAIFGVRAKRITNACDPEIPPPQAADQNCATVNPDANWSFDISWFNPATKMYYLADRDNFGIDMSIRQAIRLSLSLPGLSVSSRGTTRRDLTGCW
jgi:hypothetical protein